MSSPSISGTERPKVALGVPHTGSVHAGTMRGYRYASRGVVRCDRRTDAAGSVLCNTFNRLLADALDGRDRGEITHFAMLHSDIEPLTVGWLDVLWEEMTRAGADLIAAIVPIKEDRHLDTSTAIGRADELWAPTRYVTTADRHRLPETFTAGDVCGPGEILLVNTGCWLADLRRPWWDDFAFQTVTRIDVGPDGRRSCRFWPEDWEMSRVLQAAGARIAATWAIPVLHHGAGAWASHVEPMVPVTADLCEPVSIKEMIGV